MTLEQTTLFGVRGERVRIRKSSPIAKLAAGERADFHLRIGGPVTSAGHTVTEVWPKPNNFGFDVARISGMSGWVSQAALTRAEASGDRAPELQGGAASGCDGCLKVGVENSLKCVERDGRSGETSGFFLLALALAAFGIFALAIWLDDRRDERRVVWLSKFHDPVCERCGKVLDGAHPECVEEGAR